MTLQTLNGASQTRYPCKPINFHTPRQRFSLKRFSGLLPALSGFCYTTSQSCKNWTEAQKTCQLYNTSLIAVKNQEENVYIQHRLNGDKGWIGFNDRDTEGTFVWAGNKLSNFTYWAPRQPNDFRLNEDCVHTLGFGHKFTWNDVNCRSCHNYTCSEGNCFLFFCKTAPFQLLMRLKDRLIDQFLLS